MNLESFEKAFDNMSGSCISVCACGKVFYNPDPLTWDFNPGEIEELEEDVNAIALPYTVNQVSFEGRQYVADCDCWHKRAKQIMGFLDSHMYSIADYFKLEKERKLEEAAQVPIIEA